MSDVKGFNKYFVATDSIASAERHEYSTYEWGTDTEGNIIGTRLIQDASINNAKIGTAAIGTANIGTLTFNEISGGTATFGGTLNGDGVVVVKNSAGSVVVSLNNTGIEVIDGDITLSNGGTPQIFIGDI